MGLAFAQMPKGSTFQNQTLWGSIGWATPAAFGAALAAPDRRTVLFTGEGSHQLTAQEVSQFHRFGLKPIIFVLNNEGYLIERLLCKDPEIYYNDVVQWHYEKIPEALGCDGWFTARVTTCGELDKAIEKAEACGRGAYIEVVTAKYAAAPLAQKIHDRVEYRDRSVVSAPYIGSLRGLGPWAPSIEVGRAGLAASAAPHVRDMPRQTPGRRCVLVAGRYLPPQRGREGALSDSPTSLWGHWGG